MMFEDALTDDAKLLDVLLREQVPHPAWWVAEHAGVAPSTPRPRCIVDTWLETASDAAQASR